MQQLTIDFLSTQIKRSPDPLGERVGVIVHHRVVNLDFELAGCTGATEVGPSDFAGHADVNLGRSFYPREGGCKQIQSRI